MGLSARPGRLVCVSDAARGAFTSPALLLQGKPLHTENRPINTNRLRGLTLGRFSTFLISKRAVPQLPNRCHRQLNVPYICTDSQ